MKSLVQLWKTNPAVRAGTRLIAVSVLTYIIAAYKEGITDWHSFLAGALMAGCYAILGLFTGLEPKVGPVKPDIAG